MGRGIHLLMTVRYTVRELSKASMTASVAIVTGSSSSYTLSMYFDVCVRRREIESVGVCGREVGCVCVCVCVCMCVCVCVCMNGM